MVEVEGVSVKFTADDKDVNTRLDNLERRLDRAKEKGKKGGKEAGNAFFGGFAGGVAGVLAGGVAQSGPVNAIFDLLMNVVGAALLPLLQQLLPVVKGITGIITEPGVSKTAIAGGIAAGWAGGPAYIPAGVIAGAGQEAGQTAGNAYRKQEEARATAMGKAYQAYLESHTDQAPWYSPFGHQLRRDELTQYDLARGENVARSYAGTGLVPMPPQEVGRPYDPAFPPPNVGELHSPTVVNTG